MLYYTHSLTQLTILCEKLLITTAPASKFWQPQMSIE